MTGHTSRFGSLSGSWARTVGRPLLVLAVAVFGFWTSVLFGAFASYPYFPGIPGWEQYPEPVELTQAKVVENAIISLVVGLGVLVAVAAVSRLTPRGDVRSALRVVVYSAAAWLIVYLWRLTGRDAWGTEFDVGSWPLITLAFGTVLVWLGIVAGGVRTGLGAAIADARSRPVAAPRLSPLASRSVVVAGVMVWMWATPWRTIDRLQLSIIATVVSAAVLMATVRDLRRI